MLKFSPTCDWALVKAIATHRKLYPHLTDDFSPAPEDYAPTDHPACTYVLVEDGAEVLGFFLLIAHSPVLWEIHTALLPSAWGARARAAVAGVFRWVWANTTCQRLITNVPAYNRLALRLAERMGMQRYGLNEKSYLKNGRLIDQIELGISKPPCQ